MIKRLFQSNIFLSLCVVAGLIALCALGTWQITRMYWKEDRIARVNDRVAQAPTSLDSISNLTKEEHEYLPVSVTGTYDHASETYFFTTEKYGQPGWWVHTRMDLDDGRALIINRGFVPYEQKNPETRAEGQLQGSISLEGLLRFPLEEKPLGALENDLESREFYWRNVGQMSSIMGKESGDYLPVILDRDDSPIAGGLPRGGTTLIAFPNNHLQYAITWFGLALTLLGVGGYFIYSRKSAIKND